jgi:hypothetical protein
MPAEDVLGVKSQRAPCVPMWLLLAGAWLAGCAGQPSVKSAWQGNAPRNQTFRRILVVGVSPNYNQRCAFEFSLVSQLKRGPVVAVPSCDLIKSDDPLTRASVERAVATIDADAVLTTNLVASDWGTKEGAGRDSRGGGYYKATDYGYAFNYYGYGVPVTYGQFVESPSITTVHGQAHVVSKLYEAHGASLVYTVDTKASELESHQSFLLEVPPAIADRLRRDGLVP